jgi:methylated-DNA-[protein]-cysteine S-methyltransferase
VICDRERETLWFQKTCCNKGVFQVIKSPRDLILFVKGINTVLRYCYLESLVGQLLVAGDEEGLRHISFLKGKNRLTPEKAWIQDRHFLHDAIRQLNLYFKGKLKKFTVRLSPQGTPFQLSVLRALQEVPYGKTVSYGEIARLIGKPKASHAVGAAIARNPLPIVIPCHRVIGSNGSLTGFGGGLDIKQALLDLERIHH